MKIIQSIILICMFVFSMPVHAVTVTRLNVVLVLDVSGSMKNDTKPYKVEEAVRMFVDRFPENGSMLSIVAFTGGYDIITDKYVFDSEQDKTDFSEVIAKLNEKIDFYKTEKDGLNGTAVATAMRQGDKLISEYKDNGEYLTAMLLYTDGVNSRSAPDNEEQVIADFGNGKYGEYPIYVIEMPTTTVNYSRGEKKLNLSNLGDNNGGKWIEEIDVNNIPFHFSNIAAQLAAAIISPEGFEKMPNPTENPTAPAQLLEINGIDIANKPEDKMLENEEIIIQGVIKARQGNTNIVLGDEEAYHNYDAKFYIRKSTDKDYRVTDMEVKGGSYKTRYQLPMGIYSFYIEVWRGDTLVQTSPDRAITVLSSTPPTDISLEISPEGKLYQSSPGEKGVGIILTAKLRPEDVYNDTFFYSHYSATLLVTHNNNLIDKIPMEIQNLSYVADYEIQTAGEYFFQVEFLINEATSNRLQSIVGGVTYSKPPPLPVLCLEATSAFIIWGFIFVKRDTYFPHIYVGYLGYDIKDSYGSSKASGTVHLKSYMGKKTLRDVLGDDCANLISSEWLDAVHIKPVSKGISVAAKGNITTQLETEGKPLRKKKQLLQNHDLLTITIGDYKTVLTYTTY